MGVALSSHYTVDKLEIVLSRFTVRSPGKADWIFWIACHYRHAEAREYDRIVTQRKRGRGDGHRTNGRLRRLTELVLGVGLFCISPAHICPFSRAPYGQRTNDWTKLNRTLLRYI